MRTVLIHLAVTLFILLTCSHIPAGATETSNSYEQANNLAMQGRVNEAIKLLEKHLLQIDSDNKARMLLGHLFDYNGQPDEAVKIWEKGLDGSLDDLDFLWLIGELHLRQGTDGSTVQYKRDTVSYSPTKDKKAEEAFKKKHLRLAMESYKKAYDMRPDIPAFAVKLAQTYTILKNYSEAITILKAQVKKYPQGSKIFIELGSTLLKSGQEQDAIEIFKKVIIMNPRSEIAYQELARYYQKKGRQKQFEEYYKMAEFYSWLPSFVTIKYSADHYQHFLVLAARNIKGIPAEQFVQQRKELLDKLVKSGTKTSLELLAVLCWHHLDHGELEERAFIGFALYEKKSIPILVKLVKNAQSMCTIKKALAELVDLKAPQTINLAIELLPQDIRPIFYVNAAGALAKMKSFEAVPHLIKIANVTHQTAKPDQDPMQTHLGRILARYRAILALGVFKDQEVIQVLTRGLENPQVAFACTTALYRLTKDKKYLEQLKTAYQQDIDMNKLFISIEEVYADGFNSLIKEIKQGQK